MAAPDVDTNHYDLDVPAIVQRADAALLAENALGESPFETPTPPQDPERQEQDQAAILPGRKATRERALRLVQARHSPIERRRRSAQEASSAQVNTKNRKPFYARSGAVHFQ